MMADSRLLQLPLPHIGYSPRLATRGGALYTGGAYTGGRTKNPKRVRAGKRAARHNPWIEYLRAHEGMGETLQEEAAAYDSRYRVSHLKNPVRVQAGKRAARENPWIQFLKANEGSGRSLQQLAAEYRRMTGR
jgi:hypothetical protein